MALKLWEYDMMVDSSIMIRLSCFRKMKEGGYFQGYKIAPRIMADEHQHRRGEIIKAPTIVDQTIGMKRTQINMSAQHLQRRPKALLLLQAWRQPWGDGTIHNKRGIREYIVGGNWCWNWSFKLI
ncbi:hypothetical protein KIL84_004566 [Mauremys mutica]|uniref:Uncharacterized protein n=1 Tax=Mauremys mutica TaxID=74926 RepID=A0A9D4B7J1_9SAUR|nr:hypothetical protein KIL84_004566 [Mauremys mutica]